MKGIGFPQIFPSGHTFTDAFINVFPSTRDTRAQETLEYIIWGKVEELFEACTQVAKLIYTGKSIRITQNVLSPPPNSIHSVTPRCNPSLGMG